MYSSMKYSPNHLIVNSTCLVGKVDRSVYREHILSLSSRSYPYIEMLDARMVGLEANSKFWKERAAAQKS